MSIWTHITGCIRVDDMKMILQPNNKTDFSKIFVRNTWYHPNDNGNLPTGSEGSIDVEFIQMSTEVPTSEMKIVGYDEMAVGGQGVFKVEFFISYSFIYYFISYLLFISLFIRYFSILLFFFHS